MLRRRLIERASADNHACELCFSSAGRALDAIEKAIRTAFEKGDPSQRAYREKVYRSAFAALERALHANPNMTEAVAVRRREALSAKISEIETEFLPAVQPVQPAPAVPPVTQPMRSTAPAASEPSFEPVVTARERDFQAADDGGYDDSIEPPSYDGYGRPGRRRSWLGPVLGLVVLAAVGVGAWWLLATGVADRQSAPPPQTAEEDAPAEPPPAIGGVDNLEDWISIFDPSDPTTVTAPGDTSAEIMEDEGEQFIRITSGASGSPVLFDVGQGVLEQVAGRRAVFNVLAQVEEGETQISIECSFGELGDCGRKRYAVGVTREEFLFEIDLPSAEPGAGGTIAINPDIENGGRSVDIYAIRVSPAQ